LGASDEDVQRVGGQEEVLGSTRVRLLVVSGSVDVDVDVHVASSTLHD
jgi:hypothetical protein